MDLEFRGSWEKDPGAGELHPEVCQHLYDIKAKGLDEITRVSTVKRCPNPASWALESSGHGEEEEPARDAEKEEMNHELMRFCSLVKKICFKEEGLMIHFNCC